MLSSGSYRWHLAAFTETDGSYMCEIRVVPVSFYQLLGNTPSSYLSGKPMAGMGMLNKSETTNRIFSL